MKKAETDKKHNAQDATRKHDVDPVRRRVEALEARLTALEAWAEHLFNPEKAPASFARKAEE